MRVESIGDLFAEPKIEDTFFQPLRSTEPITILNSTRNYLSGKENIFSELNQEEGIVIIGRKDLNPSFENDHQILPSGFFLTEEEWLLFKQPHLGLEPYEQKKMGSLPKSFTPFSLTSAGGGLEKRSIFNGTASDSIWLRKCESLTTTPSLPYNEPNNNSLSHPPSLNKLFSRSQSNDILPEEDEKENWLEDVPDGGEKIRGFDIQNNIVNDINDCNLSRGPESQALINEFNNNQNSTSTHSSVVNEQVKDPILGLARGMIPEYGHQSCIHSSVGTIGSHPQPITCSSHDQIHTPSHNHYPPTKMAKQSGDSSMVSAFDFGHLQDWHYQSPEWSNPSNTQQCDWNRSLAAGKNNAIPYHSFDLPYAQPTSTRTDEMDTLLTFLSKFDDKVAAIWGQEGAVAGIPANLQYEAGHGSNSSTPVGNPNPWGSPTLDDNTTQGYYDYRAMQIQIEQQQQSLVESQRAAERFSQKHFSGQGSNREDDFPQQLKPNPSNRIAIGTSRVSPPKGKYTIMHSMKQHFGTAPSEDEYHIVRKTDAGSNEEKEKSLEILNHVGDESGFVTFLPEIQTKPPKTEVLPKSALKIQPSDIDISNMQDVLNSLDLEFEEEFEIMAACKGDPKPFIEQVSQEDLLNSWKTHFTTIEALEMSDIYGTMASPVTTLGAHQINPNLPEYRLFDGDEQDYSFFKRPGRTMFPVRYKLRWENDKSVQTEDFLEDPSYDMQSEHSYPLSTVDWKSYLPGHSDPFSSSRSRTPVDPRIIFDYDNGLEIQTSDWISDGNGIGSGSLVDFDYNGSIDGGGGGGTHVYLQADYCCDSGIGIDGSSRTEFYDDGYPDYEGDYEYVGVGGGLDDAGISIHGYSTTIENDIDYGHFQGFPFHPGNSSSSVSGKQGKGSRRRAKVKPCKYFFLDGSCRRGNDCKFSHDLTTCRYWAEGSCLKGESCPYLHCFLERKEFPGHGEFKTFGRKNYHLESENDFPALGSTKRNSLISSRVSMSDGYPPSSTCEGGDVGDSTESLLMLADQAGSIYGGFGDYPIPKEISETRGYGKRKNDSVGSTTRKNTAKEQQWFPDIKDSSKGTMRSFGGSSTGTTIPWTQHGTNKGNGHNSNSNNWISSMISVKEKRKKKKH